MTDMRRVCAFCIPPHEMGSTCGECLSTNVRRVGQWHICECGHTFTLEVDAPVSHGICTGYAEFMLGRAAAPPQPLMNYADRRRNTNALTAAVLVGGAFGIVGVLAYALWRAL